MDVEPPVCRDVELDRGAVVVGIVLVATVVSGVGFAASMDMKYRTVWLFGRIDVTVVAVAMMLEPGVV